jgi:glycosyltransferase involved in cell wall biosynthesis
MPRRLPPRQMLRLSRRSRRRSADQVSPRVLPGRSADVNGVRSPGSPRNVRGVNGEGMSLSVVIPARNEHELLGAALNALGDQSDPVDEVIVVDNDSDDATAAVARSHGGVIVVAEPRRGITYARNTGFDAATGDLIARIDADTIVTPGWARAIRRAFERDSELAGLTGPAGFTRLSSGDRVVGRAVYGLFRAVHEEMVGSGPVMYGHNMALTYSAWTGIRDLVTTGDGAVSEDLDVTLALLHTGRRVAYDPDMLVTIAVERTLHYRKLAGYHRTNRLTMAKYRSARRFSTPM